MLLLMAGIAIGVAATVVYNMVFPAQIDKASKELREELDKAQAEIERLRGKK